MADSRGYSFNDATPHPDGRQVLKAKGPDLCSRSCRPALPVVLVFALLVAGCIDPDPMTELQVSPDGRHIAIVTASRELGLLEPALPDAPIMRHSTHARGGIAWSPDSSALAFVEQYPRRPMTLWTLHPLEGRPPQPLLVEAAWIDSPGWLADGRIVFLCDREGDRAAVWSIRPAEEPELLIREPADVLALWSSPVGDALVYQVAVEHGLELRVWRTAGVEPSTLTVLPDDREMADPLLSWSADGRRLALVQPNESQQLEVVLFDPAAGQELDRIALEQIPTGLAVLEDYRVAITHASGLHLWRPQSRRPPTRQGWGDLALALPRARPGGGIALTVNANLLLMADRPDRLERGVLHFTGIEHILLLAEAQVQAGDPAAARRLLERVWQESHAGSRHRLLAATALARLERTQGSAGRAADWLERASSSSIPNSIESRAIALEALAMAAFDARRPERIDWALRRLTPVDAQDEFPRWIQQLESPEREPWLTIGGDIRAGRAEMAAGGLDRLTRQDGWTSVSLTGLGLLLDGQFEPIDNALRRRQPALERLLDHPSTHLALHRALDQDGYGSPAPEELGQILLDRMVRRGDLAGARALVLEDLKRDPPLLDYAGMLARFLDPEENQPWMDLPVTGVLLTEGPAEILHGRMTEPREALVLRLAAVKAALIEGDLGVGRAWLLQAQATLAQLPPDRVGVQIEETSHLLALADLFDAKLSEQARDWSRALAAYRRSLALMEQVPNHWGALSFEVTAAAGLIEQGQTDPELLGSYLRLLRGLGDPTINPTRQSATIRNALDNLRILRREARAPWIEPWLAWGRGFCHSLLDEPALALYWLGRARQARPTPALLQRVLIEETAVRARIGQHALAARLSLDICGMNQPESNRAAALLDAIQSEIEAGMVAAPLERARQLCQEHAISRPWRRWIGLQLGGASSHIYELMGD